MSRGQAAPRSAAAAQDVRTRPQPSPSPSSSMSKTPSLPTTTHTPNVTLLEVVNVTDDSSIGSNVSTGTPPTSTLTGGVASLNRSVWAVSPAGSSTEDYTRQKAEFYQSYDPEIGLHTAAVLGGILGWLIIYLLYKTKVKKWVLGFLRKRYKKRKQKRREQKKRKKKQLEAFAEVPDNDLGSDPTTVPVKNTHPDSEGSGGSGQQPRGDSNPCPQQPSEEGCPVEVTCPPALPPMPSIVVESCSSLPNSRPRLNSQGVEKHGDPDSPRRKSPKGKAVAGRGSEGKVTGRRGSEGKVATTATAAAASGKGGEQKKKYRRRSKGHGQGRQCPEVTVLDVDDPETTTLLLPPPPPSSQADAAQATARWVQTMPLLMQSHQDVTGLLLKIRPTLLGSKKQQSCPLISAALQYAALPLLGLPHLGLNNSMPHLADNGMGSLKSSQDLLFEDDDQQDLERNKDVQLLQPLPYSAPPASRPQSSQSHVGGSSSLPPPPPPPPPRTPLVPPIPSRVPPPPRLTISIPGSVVTPSGSSLVVPGGAGWMTSSCSAPASPVPLPVTPTVTIQNCTPRVGGRGGGRVGGGESEDSASSSSSLDPLLTLQAECHCPSRPPPPPSPSPSPSPSHYHLPPSPFPRPSHSPLPPSPLARPPPLSPLPPPSPSPSPSAVAKTPQSSWTVFDDDDGRGSCGGGGEREGSGARSRQNCFLRFTFPPDP